MPGPRSGSRGRGMQKHKWLSWPSQQDMLGWTECSMHMWSLAGCPGSACQCWRFYLLRRACNRLGTNLGG